MRFSIVIPNFNGAHLLIKNLPKVLESDTDEVIVVDDASHDESVQVIKSFPKVKLIQNQKNLGFANSVNRGVNEARGEIIALLNSDVVPEKSFLKPILPYFENEKIFAVGFAEPQFSWAKAEFGDGFIVHSPGSRQDSPHISFWASGGSAAFAAEKWKKLQGLDNLYHPFYWEDIDLSYRAAKRGWEIWWEPTSIVYHEHGKTIGKYFSQKYRDYVSSRNQLIFIWKNITDQKLFNQHKIALTKKLLKGAMWRPFWGAILRMPQILQKRKKEKREFVISDEEIFEKFR